MPAASVKYNQHGFPKDQFKQSALATRDTGMGSEERSDRRAQYARLQVAVPGGQLIRLTTTRRHSRRLRQTMINVPSCRARLRNHPAASTRSNPTTLRIRQLYMVSQTSQPIRCGIALQCYESGQTSLTGKNPCVCSSDTYFAEVHVNQQHFAGTSTPRWMHRCQRPHWCLPFPPVHSRLSPPLPFNARWGC